MISAKELRKHTNIAKNRENFINIFSNDLIYQAKKGESSAELSYDLDETPFKTTNEAVDFLSGRGFKNIYATIKDDGERAPYLTISLSWAVSIF